MVLELCISPVISSIGSPTDYADEEQYKSELENVEKLIKLIKKNIKEQTGSEPDWNEEEIILSDKEGTNDEEVEILCETLGDYFMIHHLRLYAAYIDKEGKPPETACSFEEATKDQLLLDIYDKNVETGFPHLIDHSDCDGFYIPVDFPEPFWIAQSEIMELSAEEESSEDNNDLSIGSTNKLLEELLKINNYLKLNPEDTDDLQSFADKLGNDEWEFTKWSWAVLYSMSQKSLKYKQPIVFY